MRATLPGNMLRTFACTALLIAGLISPARGDTWSENYEKGRSALERSRYREAVTFFTHAIDQKPASKASARTYGANHIDYFPYLYRGIAYAQLGEKASALSDFQKERQFGEVYKGERDTKAQGLLQRHLDELQGFASSSQPPGVQQPARKSVIDSLFGLAVDHVGRGHLMKAKALFLDVRKRNPAYPELDGYLKRIRDVEQDVKKGITAFLHGRYKEAIGILAPAAGAGADYSHAHAFLGCSYAALYLLSGARDADQAEKAHEAFRRVKQIDPKYDLDRPFISPAIRDVYAQVPAQ